MCIFLIYFNYIWWNEWWLIETTHVAPCQNYELFHRKCLLKLFACVAEPVIENGRRVQRASFLADAPPEINTMHDWETVSHMLMTHLCTLRRSRFKSVFILGFKDTAGLLISRLAYLGTEFPFFVKKMQKILLHRVNIPHALNTHSIRVSHLHICTTEQLITSGSKHI